MTKQDIIDKVRGLNLPARSYVVFGSCPMAVAGLREAGDIDMLVTDDILDQLRQAGWQQIDKGLNDKPLVWDDFEAHGNWDFSSYKPTLAQLLETADIVDSIAFASLAEVRKWKVASGRPKDLVDVQLIDSLAK